MQKQKQKQKQNAKAKCKCKSWLGKFMHPTHRGETAMDGAPVRLSQRRRTGGGKLQVF
jgi:hypothetical protein